jgi:hypothetical protein
LPILNVIVAAERGLASATQYAAADTRIRQRRFGDEIGCALEESRQSLAQAEIGCGIAGWRHRLEFDEKIDIAARGVEAIIRRGTEEIEPAHPEPSAQRVERGKLGLDDAGITCLDRMRVVTTEL